MIVKEKNVGPKIPYEVEGTKISFDDDLTLNLSKRQKDEPEHIDICSDRDGELVIGTATGRAYVAEIDIPAREYEYPDTADAAGDDGDEPEPPAPVPKPLDMDKVTLTLWALV